MEKRLERVRDKFCAAIRKEMANENYSKLPLTLKYLRGEYGLKPEQVGKILTHPDRYYLRSALPEFDIEYKPGWDFNLIITRSK